MALTYVHKTGNSGNFKVSYGVVTCTGVTSGAFATGLEKVAFAQLTPKSAATGNGVLNTLQINVGSTNTAIPGECKIMTCTAGDDYNFHAFGY